MLTTIEVLQSDIDECAARSIKDCMLARAINRQLDSNNAYVTIGATTGIFYLKSWSSVPIRFHLPEIAYENFIGLLKWQLNQSGIGVYSNTQKPRPFAFELDIPAEYLKIDAVLEYA